tara:strand:- start:167 stop:358 length:192 start_codon:yes stop_codon:yes gene_type:complete
MLTLIVAASRIGKVIFKSERILQIAIQKSQKSELVVDLATQIEEFSYLSRGLSRREKKGVATS